MPFANDQPVPLLTPTTAVQRMLRVALPDLVASIHGGLDLPQMHGAVQWLDRVGQRTDVVLLTEPSAASEFDTGDAFVIDLSTLNLARPTPQRHAQGAPSLRETVNALTACLFVPAAYAGLVGVDWADYVSGLGGRRMRLHRFEGANMDTIACSVIEHLAAQPVAYLAIHVSLPRADACMAALGTVAAGLDVLLPRDVAITLALTPHASQLAQCNVIVAR